MDGNTLKVYQWKPKTKSKAQILVNHGFLEHALRYTEFAQAMNARQIAVTAFDVRGHGSSSGQRAYVSHFGDYCDDLTMVMGTGLDFDSPKFLLGHSNGGLTALEYFRRNDTTTTRLFSGLIITSPWLGPAGGLPEYKIVLSKVLGYLVPWLSIPAEPLTVTSDAAKQKEYNEDPKNQHNITLGWAYQSMLTQEKVQKEGTRIPIPLLYSYGDQDQVANPQLNKKFGEVVQSPDKTVIEQKGFHHEVLNETNREELYEIIADWVLKRV